MNDTDNTDKETSLFKQVLRGKIAGERQILESPGLTPQMALMRQWQVERLKGTYNDLLHHPKYQAAAEFFLSDLYGAQDFSQRDADAENVYKTMRKYLPDRLLVTMGKAIELNKMTQALDVKLLDVLVNQVGMDDSLSIEQYTEAYRLCDNYAERSQQIDLVLEVGQSMDNLTRIPMIGMVLRAARRPARRSGWNELQDFLERGFGALKQMKGADPFFKIVEERERRILDQIFARAANPFDLNNLPSA
jgi:hypothetical protein